jgi:hypothetical protein
LSSLVYRSRAVPGISPPDLHDITSVAQRRNGREDVTGLLLYDDGYFFQWLEGPKAGVERVMASIRRDARHSDIEVLKQQKAQARRFGDWTMKLAAPVRAVSPWRDDIIEPPPELVQRLRTKPEAAPVLLTRLGPARGRDVAVARGGDAAQGKLNSKTTALLKDVLLTIIIPRIVDAAAPEQQAAVPATSARAVDLAELLIAAEQDAALELIRELHGTASSTGKLYATLLEPAARSLGDMWTEDICSEFDFSIGLGRLQAAVRLLSAESFPIPDHRGVQPVVLIVPEPGELHRLGAALDSSVLDNAGWSPHSEYPDNDRALQEMLSSDWFDVLDLSLSVALRREHLLPRVNETIAAARRASRNKALLVVVGGRVFFEGGRARDYVGANLASRTSGNVDRSILRAMTETTTETVSVQADRVAVLTAS